jgi:hypothetical protein
MTDHDIDPRAFNLDSDMIIVPREALTRIRDEVAYAQDRAKYYNEIPKSPDKFDQHCEKLKTELTAIIRDGERTLAL